MCFFLYIWAPLIIHTNLFDTTLSYLFGAIIYLLDTYELSYLIYSGSVWLIGFDQF